jgi:ParB family transcriptional regulator, chromosome partitioning protein
MTQLYSVDVTRLRPDPDNVRIVGDDDVADLVASMGSPIGQLTPIIVRRREEADGEIFTVVAGARRVAAARQLGWTEIDAIELVTDRAVAVSAAENMVRAPMHPVDQWRAMVSLIDAGMSLNGAAEALGIEDRLAKRLDMLGRMAPSLVEAMAGERELPRKEHLATIALAPADVQEKALHGAKRANTIDWHRVAQNCDRRRLSRSIAIFDVESAGVAFDEDLFAEPGSPDQFTTTDVKGFVRAQTKALGERIAASKGRMVGVGADHWGALIAPVGWTMAYDPVPKRWKKDDTRKHAVAVLTEGYNIGCIVERVMHEKPKRVAQPSLVGGNNDDAPVERAPRDPITKTVQSQIAALKTEAVREGVAAFTRHGVGDMLRLLLLTFAADNISVTTSSQKYGEHGLDWLANGLVSKDGGLSVDYGPDELCAMAADVIIHCIAFDHPNSNFGTSGAAAEWIGQIVGAIDFMPRMDTADILKGFSYDALVEVARSQGISEDGTAKAIRERMVGKMPEWRPVTFGAPVPEPVPVEDDEGVSPEELEQADQEDAA